MSKALSIPIKVYNRLIERVQRDVRPISQIVGEIVTEWLDRKDAEERKE